MSEVSSPPHSVPGSTEKQHSMRKSTRRTAKKSRALESNCLDFLPWNQTVSGDESFTLLSDGAEGGFLSLEEFDESEYGFIGGLPELTGNCSNNKKKGSTTTSSNSKKRKRGNFNAESEVDAPCVLQEVNGENEKCAKKQKKRKNRIKDHKSKGLIAERDPNCDPIEGTVEESSKIIAESGIDEEPLIGDDEIYAWNVLRLHPLLLKSIRRLGFKEPTPIQRACIPIASHKGKDVIGAAQTGSGKTLAFGLPILQRLLEEREKTRSLLNDTEVIECSKERYLRALILVPTRELALQVSDHLKKAAKGVNIYVVSIVGGIYSKKQERLLKGRPEIVVATPGRLWELMSEGNEHLVELHSLSFFVLDEADRMIENGHFNELQSIVDMLPTVNGFVEQTSEFNKTNKIFPNLPRKKRQTFVFSATIALSNNFRKKLKRSSFTTKSAMTDGLTSIEKLSERAGMRPDVAIVDLTNTCIVADKLVESFMRCGEEEKEAYLYYILSVHRKGRSIVFCTSIAALRRVSSLLSLLDVSAWTLHAQMQQRARLKAMDRFCSSEHGVLVATDVAARGLDIPGIRTVVHYQLPHSAEVYIHRSGRTARASCDGCSIALISPNDQAKFSSLCKSLSKDSFQEFRVDTAYMPDVLKRLSLARQIDKIQRRISQVNAKKSWFERNAESLELCVDDTDDGEELLLECKQNKISSIQLKDLQQGLRALLSKPFQPREFSHRFLAANGISPLLQKQLEEFSKSKLSGKMGSQERKTRGLVVIGQDSVEPLQALRDSGLQVCVNTDKKREARQQVEKWKNKKREEKKRDREQKRKARKAKKKARYGEK